MKRNIVEIDKEKCNGCGLCVNACHEGAIKMIDGKACLTREDYCDGLGACLPECPAGAIKIVERECLPFTKIEGSIDNIDFSKEYKTDKGETKTSAKEYKTEREETKTSTKENNVGNNNPLKKGENGCGCLGTQAKLIDRSTNADDSHKNSCGCKGTQASVIDRKKADDNNSDLISGNSPDNKVPSMLNQWPVQMRLINPMAPYLKNADLLIAADCTAYAYGNFHSEFIKDHITVIWCPKLDDNEYYIDKLSEILKINDLRSITVVRMQVPCCSGITYAVKKAMLNSQIIVPYREVIISSDGKIIE